MRWMVIWIPVGPRQVRTGSVEPTPTPTVTASPTPTPTTSPTPTPTIGTGCSVSYVIQNDWGNGATINITITNNGTESIDGWELKFSFPGNQQITNLWCAKYTQTGSAVTVTNEAWNSLIPPNATVNLGFNISYSGTNTEPVSFIINGKPASL